MSPFGDGGHVDVASPAGGSGISNGVLGGIGGISSNTGITGCDGGHHVADGGRCAEAGRGVEDTEHTALAVVGSSAVEEDGVGIVDDLGEDEALVLEARSKGSVTGLVAGGEGRRLGDGVAVGSPHELDGITDSSIEHEGDIAQNTLGRCDDNSVGNTVSTCSGLSWGGNARGRSVSSSSGAAVGSNAF